MESAHAAGIAVRGEETLDGVHADPAHHRLLLENQFVRVIESVIPVGERTPLHTHRHHRVMYAVSGASFARRDERGVVIESARIPDGDLGQRVMWAGPTELHTIENTGDQDLVVIAFEVRCEHGTGTLPGDVSTSG
jgi:hypothetical protein